MNLRFVLRERHGGARLTDLAIVSVLLAWFAYTRLYFVLHPIGLTFDPSLFMALTGEPDPTCGLTRTFAWTWRGDLVKAAGVYPLGPVLFAIAAVVTVNLLASGATGRRIGMAAGPQTTRFIISIAASALAVNWATKLIWLGM